MPASRRKSLAAAGSALGSLVLAAAAFAQPVNVSIDVKAGLHPINPYVYGVSYGTPAQLAELRSPLVRMGGNNTSRYNWQVNADNRARDWYYESIGADSGSAVAGEVGDTFIANARAGGAEPMLTFPMLDWIAKLGPNRAKLASFSVAKYGRQTAVDRWFRDAGNGILRRGGVPITGNDPNDANASNTSTVQAGWASHLVTKWAASGRLRYYILDNEHSIWQETHRDVHPAGAPMEEIRGRMIDYAAKLKAVDPDAQIVGPEEWGWSGFELSGADQQYGKAYGWARPLPDEKAHCPGGVLTESCWYLPWLLTELKNAEAQNGGRPLLDVFTVHWYPQGGEYGDDTSQSMQLLRNRSTRVLWDPSYLDPTWINDYVQLVPRLRRWADTYHHTTTRIGITEYSWGADGHINGATTQADILGIFGREGLDLGARWVMPDSTTPTYKAMKIWRNYDNNGGAFGDTSVQALAPNPDEVSAFAGLRANGTLTVVVINKVAASRAVTLSLANFTPAGSASLWQLTSANAINRLADLAVGGSSFTVTVPAQSITMVVVPGQ